MWGTSFVTGSYVQTIRFKFGACYGHNAVQFVIGAAPNPGTALATLLHIVVTNTLFAKIAGSDSFHLHGLNSLCVSNYSSTLSHRDEVRYELEDLKECTTCLK
jgi:hypothetical protein